MSFGLCVTSLASLLGMSFDKYIIIIIIKDAKNHYLDSLFTANLTGGAFKSMSRCLFLSSWSSSVWDSGNAV